MFKVNNKDTRTTPLAKLSKLSLAGLDKEDTCLRTTNHNKVHRMLAAKL